MRLSSILFAAILFAVPTIVSGYSSGAPVKAGPAIVPIQQRRQPANVVYESGNDFIHAGRWSPPTAAHRNARRAYALRVRYRTESVGGASRWPGR